VKKISFVEADLKRYRRAFARATKLDFHEYLPHLKRIITELEAIVNLDEEVVGEKNG